MNLPARRAKASVALAAKIPTFSPADFRMFTSLEVPNPIEFVTGEKWCNRPNLYPRQATLIKVIFLREDLFTEYDYMVVEEWETSFRHTGNNGITPGILERMRWLKANGYKWFREVLLVMGRRAGKGYLSALCMAYVMWHYMAKSDPQGFYGVDRDKKLSCLIFAGKQQQARDNLWRDLVNVITGAPCYAPYIANALGEKLTVYAPNDRLRMKRLAERGISTEMDLATFEIVPKESTLMAGRGPTSFMQGYDEMAHVIATGANRSAEEVYQAATPSLDQFGKDGFIIEPSSPWQMLGQFYENYKKSLAEENGQPLHPEVLMVQLASWDIYKDWEDAHLLEMWPDGPTFAPLKGAMQTYDDAMVRLERANPETFAVERRSHWATALDAYLKAEKVAEMFGTNWDGRALEMQQNGLLSITYKGHADPSLANANFGLAIAHPEVDESGTIHCVFDLIKHWNPADFPDRTIDYVQIEEEIWDIIRRFTPDEFTFDQWNSASAIAHLQKRVREQRLPKRVQIFEKTATARHNWERAENFKAALYQGWVHAPYYEQAELELKFLQLKNGNKVEKPDAGPVQTKDVADCIMECVQTIVGDQVNNFVHGSLNKIPLGGAQPGGIDPFPQMREDVGTGLMAFTRQMAANPGRRPRTGAGLGRGRPEGVRRPTPRGRF